MYVPRDLRRQIFEHLRGTAHPGRRATRRLMSSRYVWKGFSTDVTAWVKACLGCQRAKVNRQVQVPPQHIPVPTRRFSHIHVDLVGPLLASKGFTYLFTIIGRTSCWPEAIPIAATTTVDCANALFQGWVSRFGVLAVITSDRGAQFTSSLWAALYSLLNIQHNQTTANHPQSNGMVERFHRRLKDTLRARCAAANWVDHLPWVLLGLRAAAREDNGSTPAQAAFSPPLILPGQFLDSPELPSKIFLEQFSKTLSAAEHTATRHNTAAACRPPPLPDDLARAPTVFVRRDGHVPPLQLLYDGPYTVIRRSLHRFTLRIGDKEDKVSTLRLKPSTDPTAPPALPRVWGRPPAAVHFRDFPPPGAPPGTLRPTAPAEPLRELFFPGTPPGGLHPPPPFLTPPPLDLPATAERRPDLDL
jgi:transposase InsO family protein